MQIKWELVYYLKKTLIDQIISQEMNRNGSHSFFQHPQGVAAKLQTEEHAELFLLCLLSSWKPGKNSVLAWGRSID